jgi:2-polyprenyl-3-methyl-5-hydroxy-6-metoxy-1,4-benzoquinol methylase
MSNKNLYIEKTDNYYAGARRDWVDRLPINDKARLLEIGCGNGDTGMYALSQKKCGYVCGVELNEVAANEAKAKITEVLIGDVEHLDLPFNQSSFDILMMSELLEHLVDPWAVLTKIRPFMKHGALVFSSSPNVANINNIKMLLGGDWKLELNGVMDRTHLRWFTPKTYREMFESSGYTVTSIGPVTKFGLKKRIVSLITMSKYDYLLSSQINLEGFCKN